MAELTIGELANRTGVATSALRYWEELGLLSADRVAGQRHYSPAAVTRVGEILALRDVGFTLREIGELLTARASATEGWRELHERKLAELDERMTQIQLARTAITHGLACKHPDVRDCPTYNKVVTARAAGLPLSEAHPHKISGEPFEARHPAE